MSYYSSQTVQSCHITVLRQYSHVILQFSDITVMSFYSSQTVQSCHITVLRYYCHVILQFSDSTEAFELAHMNAFDSICHNELAKDPNNIQYVNGLAVINPSILTCPNQCSKNGRCIGTTCHCNHGYTSADCSVRIGVAPTIHRLRGSVFYLLLLFVFGFAAVYKNIVALLLFTHFTNSPYFSIVGMDNAT